MPITKFQREVLLLLKQNRNPNSYVAGGVAIHRSDTSLRHSNDIDFFHDTDEAVTAGARSDRTVLQKNEYEIITLIEQPSFVRAVVRRGSDSLKLEWARDTAFRFFPVEDDKLLGYRLHDIDLAVNKCLALANRNEVRDILDLIQLHKGVISLAAACWAACGKDPGFTPTLLLDQMQRNSIIRPENLVAEATTKPLSPSELKLEWLSLLENTRNTLDSFPTADIGCVFLDDRGEVLRRPMATNISSKRRHFGSVGGSWPRLVEHN